MAAKKETIGFDFKFEAEGLAQIKKDLEIMLKDGKLSNVNMNTYKSALSQIDRLFNDLNRAAKKGPLTAEQAQPLLKTYEKLSQAMSKMVSQEAASGKTDAQHAEALEQAKKAQDEIIAKLKIQKDLLEQMSKIKVKKDGTMSNESQSQAMKMAYKQLKGDKKGRDSAVESLLKKGDMGTIQNQAVTGNPKEIETAKKAIEEYNKYVDNLKVSVDEVKSTIAQLNEELSSQRAVVNELEDESFYNPDDLDELKEKVQEVTGSYEDLGSKVEQAAQSGGTIENVTKAVNKNSSAFAKAARTLINYQVIYRSIRKLFKEGINAIQEMDRALTGMSLVTGQTREQLYDMIPTLNNLAQATGSTQTEVANLTTEYIRQGRTMRDAMTLAEQTAKTAKIAGISTADAIQYMTAAINGFNLSANSAEHVSDIFAKLASTTATSAENIAIALSKVSAQANTAGMSIEFTSALLAKGLETTQEAPESIGTALKTILARMREMTDYGKSLEDNTDINKVEKALQAVGVSLRDANGQFRDMETIFRELGPQWDSLNTMQQQAIAEAVAGTRQQARFLAIMQD